MTKKIYTSKSTRVRNLREKIFHSCCVMIASFAIIALAVLLLNITVKSIPAFRQNFEAWTKADMMRKHTAELVNGLVDELKANSTDVTLVIVEDLQEVQDGFLACSADSYATTRDAFLAEIEEVSQAEVSEEVCLQAQEIHTKALASFALLDGLADDLELRGIRFGIITNDYSEQPGRSGMRTAIAGTVLVCVLCILFAVVFGVATSVLLEEFSPKNKLLKRLHGLVETNIRNLAGVPSIVYGIVGLYLFSNGLGLFGEGKIFPVQTVGQVISYQYTDAAGNMLFATAENDGEALVPLYKESDTVRRPSQVWRDHPHRKGQFLQVLGQEEPLQVQLTLAQNSWQIEMPVDAIEKMQIGDQLRYNIHDTAYGQRWSTFTVEALNGNIALLAGAPIGHLYTQSNTTSAEHMAEVEFMTHTELMPVIEQVENGLDDFGNLLNRGLRNLKVREGGEQLYRVAEEDAIELAEKVSDNDLFDEAYQAEVQELTQAWLMSIDGELLSDVRAKKNEFIDEVGEPLKTKLLTGRVLLGQNPNLTIDKTFFHMTLPLGSGVLAGGLTLMLVILPVVIIASQEALRAVPSTVRLGAFGLGATPWQTVSKTVLPAAVPGICTGVILAMSRAIGEAAPLLVISGVVKIDRVPKTLMDQFAVMPLQIYHWAGAQLSAFEYVTAAGIVILLIILFAFNLTAILIRQMGQKNH